MVFIPKIFNISIDDLANKINQEIGNFFCFFNCFFISHEMSIIKHISLNML